jgi:predicted transcriptional regulator
MSLIDYILLTGQVAMAITAVGALLISGHRYLVVKPIQRYIDEATKLIHPSANGGKSLPDIALGVARVEAKLETINKRVDTLEKSIKSSN